MYITGGYSRETIVANAVPLPLAGWENFYIIVGSSGAALIGLQFVVLALIAETRFQSSPESLSAFGTPTIVHFAGAFLISVIMSAPWYTLGSVGVALAVSGVVGVGYVALVIRRARGQTAYKPVMEDIIWHMVLPLLAYASLLVAAVLLPAHVRGSLFTIGGSALLLLFIGIHNAWDTVTYIVVEGARNANQGDAKGASSGEHDE